MISLFLKGGPIMWPILITSLIAVTVVLERLFFLLTELRCRDPEVVSSILTAVEHHQLEEAIALGKASQDCVARVLTYGLLHRNTSLSDAMLRSATLELERFNSGIAVLDTIITLAPLLGLLGTVTGMIHAFGLLGTTSLTAPTVITGGIAEALIATAFGLAVAIIALLPFNYLNAQLERIRHQIQDAASHLELVLIQAAFSNEK